MRLLIVTLLLALTQVSLIRPAAASMLPRAPEQGAAAGVEHQRAVALQARQRRWSAAAERQLADHEAAVSELFSAAERYEEDQVDRVAALAALGYTGDADEAQVVLPLAGYRLTASYGSVGLRWSTIHTGLDFAAPLGTPLVAAASATVTSVAHAGAYGLRTVLTLTDGTELWYCHQLASLVAPGEVVEIGTPMGLLGTSGNSTGPHLHLEVRPSGGDPVDPRTWLEAFDITP